MSDSQRHPAALPERLTLEQAVPVLANLRVSLQQQAGPTAQLNAAALLECDSSAVAVLLELRRSLQQQGKKLQLMDSPQRLHDLVTLYGVQELFSFSASEPDRTVSDDVALGNR